MSLIGGLFKKEGAVQTAVAQVPGGGFVNGALNALSSLKKTDKELFKTRDLIDALFTAKGVSRDTLSKVYIAHKVNVAAVPNQKVGGNYNSEFSRLYDVVTDLFNKMGRTDLAQKWVATVARFNESKHPVDFASTLLNGASQSSGAMNAAANSGVTGGSAAPKSVINKALENLKVVTPAAPVGVQSKFSLLTPFKPTMQQALVSKGVAAPSDMESLTQVFYNNFVAKEGSSYEALDFADITPEVAYHLDEQIITAVLGYVKNLADQKKKGEILPKALDKIATDTIVVEQKLTEKTKEQVASEIGSQGMSTKTMLIIGGVIVVVIVVLFFMFKRK